MSTEVTVIIPAFNEGLKIQRCIDSLLVQTIVPNIIVVNDGSTDDTLDKLTKYEPLKNFSLINQKNQGVSAARNRGIKATTTDFVTFVDADDYVEKKFVETLLDGFSIENNIDLSICNYSMQSLNSDTTFYGNFNSSVINRFEYFNSVIDEMGVNGFIYNKLFKKSIIDNNHISFDSQVAIGEDFLFCFLYGNYCKKIALNDSMQIHYLPTESGASDIMQIDGRFSNKMFDYFFANLRIVKYLNSLDSNEKMKPIINKEICRTAIAANTIIRKSYLYNSGYEKLDQLTTFLRENWHIIKASKSLNVSTKAKILMSLYCPKLLSQFDKMKFKGIY